MERCPLHVVNNRRRFPVRLMSEREVYDLALFHTWNANNTQVLERRAINSCWSPAAKNIKKYCHLVVLPHTQGWRSGGGQSGKKFKNASCWRPHGNLGVPALFLPGTGCVVSPRFLFFFAFLTNNKKKGANDNKHYILLSWKFTESCRCGWWILMMSDHMEHSSLDRSCKAPKKIEAVNKTYRSER